MDGTILEVSPSVAALSNGHYKRIELIGTSAAALYNEPYERALILSELKQRGYVNNYDIRLLNRDGASIQGSISARIIFDGAGAPLKIAGSIHDMTKFKKTEKELIRAKEKAEESDRLKSAFLANISHEIRTPMNGILGFAELLKMSDVTPEEQKEYVDIIKLSGERMLNLINNIVDIPKIEAGLMELNLTDTDIHSHTNFIFSLFKTEAENNGIELSYKNGMPSKEFVIKTDSEKLYALLTNLVKNAIKFTPNGSIEFGYTIDKMLSDATSASPLLTFFVKDTGIGIPKERQEAIFDRFIQADITNKRAFQGAGLGLSISKSYLEQLGGEIWVESEEGIGSTFYFTLPSRLKPVEKSGDQNLGEDSGEQDTGCSDVAGLKILIAEDDTVSESFLRLGLKKINQEIISVTTGIEAVNICRTDPGIDLVLMDFQMHEMNGINATRQIRQFNKDIIIIAQTAHRLSGDRELAIEAGCNDYILKPISIELLLKLIQKHFREVLKLLNK